VHKLHGVTCYASLPRLRRIVIAFEQQLNGASRDSLKTLVEELDAELATVECEVDQCLQRFADSALSD
jgi:HPt (histidine-containing phosphotransfer) domain-containing protein